MKLTIRNILAAGLLFGAFYLSIGVNVQAAKLDTEVPVAGISLVLNEYIDTNDGAETEIAGLLPEKVEKAEPARNEVFNNMAIAFVDNYVNVRKKPSTDSKIVGKIYNNCSATIISEEDGWYKIESGNVTGYIASEFFLTGADAEEYAIENGYVFARVTDAGLRVRARSITNARVVTSVYENEVYAVKDMTDNGKWTKLSIEEGLRGWVSSDFIELSVNMDTALTLKEEKAKIKAEKEAEAEALRQAQAEAEAEEESRQAEQQQEQNYYSDDSSSDDYTYTEPETTAQSDYTTPSYDSSTGAAVVSYAMQFLGNPYVYGGSSLTNGTDCSGFTMSVYAHFGYSISRSSYTQAYDGVAVDISDIQPGDLLFYNNGNSSIEHVGLYMGNGQVIHASTPETGIKISNAYGMGLVCARRIITN